MSSISNKVLLQEYEYDFAVDGGTNGSNILLSDKDGKSNIPVGAIIKSVFGKVITDFAGSSTTVSWGTSATADGYSGTAIAEATLVPDFLVNGWDLGGSLLWDDTNDHMLTPYVVDAAAGSFAILINVADLTAGKMIFVVEYIMPSVI